MYNGFFKKEESKGMAVEQIIELTSHKFIMSFIKENCSRLMSSLTSLEATRDPLACTVYNTIADLSRYLYSGTTKTSFCTETDALMQKKPQKEQKAITKTFYAVFQAAFSKLEGHIEQHPAFPIYKAARIFDPRQLGSLSHGISEYPWLGGPHT